MEYIKENEYIYYFFGLKVDYTLITEILLYIGSICYTVGQEIVG